MHYNVTHTTRYRYEAPVSLCQNIAHLTPRNVAWQHCSQSILAIQPEPAVLSSWIDYFGNQVTFFSVQEPHRELTVTARHKVEVMLHDPLEPERSPAWEVVRDRLATEQSPAILEAYQFVFPSRLASPTADLAEYARPSFPPGRPLLEAVLDLTRRIHHDFCYDPRATTITTTLQEVLEQRCGVCQDFAHLQIACLRALRLAARYVSGYLATNPPPGQPRLLGADATHAWVSIYCPQAGWVDIDPTNNQPLRDRHVLLAWGRDYDDVSPIKGVALGGGHHTITVAVDVVETPPEDEANESVP